jgi:hypothetical protein
MDSDFQERMFARQMAVMKGQAWNVVETLKTLDHGPLELTRRAKVCVWDDLVDVPVAVPMRVASAEMRRRATAQSDSAAAFAAAAATNSHHHNHARPSSDIIAEEEMDIGAATTSRSHPASAPATSGAVIDLLGNTSPPADLPHPGRFELALADDPLSPSPLNTTNGAPDGSSSADTLKPNPTRPQLPRGSHSHRTLNMYSPDRGTGSGNIEHQQRFSFTTTAASRRESNSIAAQLYNQSGGSGSAGGGSGRASYDFGFTGRGGGYEHDYEGGGGHAIEDEDDELEGGDLGYAAATGMEGNRRKVIVERLEAVKTRNPVFTWC